jgi:hypothetical protein
MVSVMKSTAGNTNITKSASRTPSFVARIPPKNTDTTSSIHATTNGLSTLPIEKAVQATLASCTEVHGHTHAAHTSLSYSAAEVPAAHGRHSLARCVCEKWPGAHGRQLLELSIAPKPQDGAAVGRAEGKAECSTRVSGAGRR